MLTFHKRGTGVLLTWCFIVVSVVYVVFVVGRKAVTVDGSYSEWSDFTACSAKCGGGARSRTRSCTNPIPNYFGQNCSQLGPAIETMECNKQPCPIDGKFGAWGAFGPCSVTCGRGTHTRERKCDNPQAQHGGQPCPLQEATETKPCDANKPCPVNGGYGEWSAWSACSVTCGSGQRTRSRECNKPVPQFGGKNCVQQNFGENKGTEECTETPCPVNTRKRPETTQAANNGAAI